MPVINEFGRSVVTALGIARALADTAKEAGPNGAPLGPMYLAFMDRGLSYSTFETMIDVVCKSGLCKRSNDCLVYIGNPNTTH